MAGLQLLFPGVLLLFSAVPCSSVRSDTAQDAGEQHALEVGFGLDRNQSLLELHEAIPSLRVAMPLPGFTGDNCMRKDGVVSALYELVCEGALGSDGELKVLAWSLKGTGDLGVGSSWFQKADANTRDLQARFGTGCSFEDFWRKSIVPSLSDADSWPSRDAQDAFYEGEAKRMLQQAHDLGFNTAAFYLSIPPSAFGTWASAVGKVQQLPEAQDTQIRIVVEKPLGRDTSSFRQLMQTFKDAKLTDQELYLLDHYSGKEMIMSMPFLFGRNNRLQLCRHGECNVAHLRVVQMEARDVAGRDFEDIGGQVRDMVQSHLLQMLATFVAGEGVRPKCPRCGNTEWANYKLHVLQSFRVVGARMAQYEGYLEDGKGKARHSETPTYACLELRSSLKGWEDTVFEIETGKSVDRRTAYLEVIGKNGDVARVSVQPEMGLEVPRRFASLLGTLNLHLPGLGALKFNQVKPVETEPGMVMYSPQGRVPSAYAYILEAVFIGNHKLFCNMAEVEQQWLLVQDFLEARPGVQLPMYAQGTPAEDVKKIALSS